ncbi:DEAD/DEAH box helicase [Pendulispora albinea]|uniref:DEAD/DEAH box helicase n=1 Tax=Pendulispora albinea TaxID=2741071 RepID=A0ABZ2LYL0_9BACT
MSATEPSPPAAAAPTLRPYQREAIDAVLSARRQGVRRMVVSLPTGAGKTVIFSHLARVARRQVLVIAHREELLGQARDKIERAMQGQAVVAIERGAERASSGAKVLVCSVRSLHEERLARVIRGRDVGLVIYDECHHAAADDNLRVLRQLGVFDEGWTGTLLGFTATTERGDGKGLDEVFERIVYSRTLPQMIEDGYLCTLRGFRVATDADLRKIRGGGADFPEEELAEAVDIEERNAVVARSIQELARDRRTIAFCVTVGHARNLARSLNALGVPAGIVHGAMRSEDRARALADFRRGHTQVLTNVAVLIEGFDDPGVSCIAMARPTRSEGLYAQCVGRGTRLSPEKKDCLILDFVDLSDLSLTTLPSLFGAPRDLDLRGGDVNEARRIWEQIQFDRPGFELEAGALTLPEIQDRAKGFDPLTLKTNDEVRAISANAWFSLGRHGVGLHFEKKAGRPSEALVLVRGARGKKWEVSVDGKVVDRFSRMEDAVAAVDYEIDRRGRATAASARHEASWRSAPAPATIVEGLRAKVRPTRWSDALQLEVWERIVGR